MEKAIILVFVLVYAVCATSTPCSYEGHLFNYGDTWMDKDSCDWCSCGEYGVYCRARTNQRCPLSGTGIQPLSPLCTYALHAYQVGQVFNTLDGCNKCLCTEQGMQCTAKACSPNGFANGTKTPLFGWCLYDNIWYGEHAHWRARDQCNTCYCWQPGNYQGQYVCTKSICRNQISTVSTSIASPTVPHGAIAG